MSSKKIELLYNQKWPYHIDKQTFVKNYDYFLYKNSDPKVKYKNNNCLDDLEKSVLEAPVILSGYYGMGKSTLVKTLFENWNNHQKKLFFFNLRYENLHTYIENNLYQRIINEISFINNMPNSSDLSILNNEFEESLVLIFDGIDEVILEKQTDLHQFLRFIFNTNFSFIIVTRLEYNKFFEALNIVNNKKYFNLELCEWNISQWTVYIENIKNLYSKFKNEIEIFESNLNKGIYSNLPKRPLFLKMLTDLEVRKSQDIQIYPDLRTNIAEIYYKFIKWKIRDDYDRYGLDYDWAIYQEEAFELLSIFAIEEYKIDRGIVKKQSLKKIMKMIENLNFNYLNTERFSDVFFRSGYFSILSRIPDQGKIIYSHKSFMEYLVAFSLVNCIFDNQKDISICNEIWSLFQTHEVSKHFVDEIKRVEVIKNISKTERDKIIAKKFEIYLGSNGIGDFFDYDDKKQVVIYYFGKLNIIKESIVKLMHEIVENKDKCNFIYYRTASIALSRINGSEYCENYVHFLLESYSDVENQYFEKNISIQKEYYGEENILNILNNDLNEYINSKNSLDNSSIISLKLLTYCYLSNKDDVKKVLLKIRRKAIINKQNGLANICNEIEKTLIY